MTETSLILTFFAGLLLLIAGSSLIGYLLGFSEYKKHILPGGQK
jgi:hypothetical protein